jgi:hypothetical protein
MDCGIRPQNESISRASKSARFFGPEDARSRQTGVDLNTQALAVELVDHVESSEPSGGPQRIGHEVTKTPVKN